MFVSRVGFRSNTSSQSHHGVTSGLNSRTSWPWRHSLWSEFHVHVTSWQHGFHFWSNTWVYLSLHLVGNPLLQIYCHLDHFKHVDIWVHVHLSLSIVYGNGSKHKKSNSWNIRVCSTKLYKKSHWISSVCCVFVLFTIKSRTFNIEWRLLWQQLQ